MDSTAVTGIQSLVPARSMPALKGKDRGDGGCLQEIFLFEEEKAAGFCMFAE